jgi:CubicO group peptidase (beta-lactamase class C family)
MLFGFPFRITLGMFNPRSNFVRALAGSDLVNDSLRVYARDFEVPAGGGVGTARAIARAYSVFATGGRELQIRPETLRVLSAPAVPPGNGFYDECMQCDDIRFSLGFMKPGTVWRFGSHASFGFPGAGGSIGFADPATGIGYAYVTSQMGTALTGDPRDVALREALDSVIAPTKIAAAA